MSLPATAEVELRAASHAEARKHSYALLERARAEAHKRKKYDSLTTRRLMTEECQKRTGLVPYPEQLDLAECMLLGLDTTCIAGTGWGKTLPFALPLFVPQSKGKIILIASPLNSLEDDQATRFRKMDIAATAVNGETQSQELHNDIACGRYSIIVIGPKLLVERMSTFRILLSNPKFAKRVLAFIVDEAHCIAQWGGDFRPEYSLLGEVRALLTLQTSICATSATMNPPTLSLVRQTLHISAHQSFHLNIGNDRPNITWEVRRMAAGKSDLEALAFLLPPEEDPTAGITKRMVFFDDINVSMKAWRWLTRRLPPALQERVKVYNSRRGTLAKKLVMHGFQHGNIDLLLTTEAAGMGCDLPDVVEVVQFMIPDSFPVWVQRAGRAGRHPDIQARAILLVQPTVFQEKGKRTRQEGEPVVYVKEIDKGLRTYVDPPPNRCRRDVADEYFDNPPRRKSPTGECCDNCTRRAQACCLKTCTDISSGSIDADAPAIPRTAQMWAVPEETPPTSYPNEDLRTFCRPDSPPHETITDLAMIDQLSTAQSLTIDPYSPDNWRAYLRATRTAAEEQEARKRLQTWRYDMWCTLYSHQPFGPAGILPDALISSLASRTTFTTVNDLASLRWLLAKRHGAEVLAVLHKYDRECTLPKIEDAKQKAQEAQAKQEKRDRERAEKVAEKDREREARERLRAEKTAQKERESEAKRVARNQEKSQRAEETARKKVEGLKKRQDAEARRQEQREEKVQHKQRKAVYKAVVEAAKAAQSCHSNKSKPNTSSHKRNRSDHSQSTPRKRYKNCNKENMDPETSTIALIPQAPKSYPRPRPQPRPLHPLPLHPLPSP